jgi:uncharacterized alpha-E superfamily protein
MMLSRVAEQLYWIGRHLERAEDTVRVVEVNGHLLLDLPRGIAPGWRPLVAITGGEKLFEDNHDEYSERNVVRFLIGDPANPSSMISALANARENARTVRDYLPRDAWQLINELYLFARGNIASGLGKRSRTGFLQRITRDANALVGLTLGSMNHDAGLSFLALGRMVERADMTTRIIDVRSASLLPEMQGASRTFENIQWISVLKSLTAYQMYRRKMQVRVRRQDALRFLLADDEFPRSVYFCVNQVAGELSRLPRGEGVLLPIGRLLRTISGAPLAELVDDQSRLNTFIDELQKELAEVHVAIRRTYFLVDESVAAGPETAGAGGA